VSATTKLHHGDAEAIAVNLRRLMARDGLTFCDVVQATGLDERTVRGLARGTNKPHSRTLHKLAQGLDVLVDELFQPPAGSMHRFDRATNPEIESIVSSHAGLFHHWLEADFDELYSHFGTGGPLNESGVLAAAEAINAKRSLLRQVCVILESGESELLFDLVRLLYRRISVSDNTPADNSGNEMSAGDSPRALRIHESHDGCDR
jgi:transcriptional regulator with XRE-family HTH domain